MTDEDLLPEVTRRSSSVTMKSASSSRRIRDNCSCGGLLVCACSGPLTGLSENSAGRTTVQSRSLPSVRASYRFLSSYMRW